MRISSNIYDDIVFIKVGTEAAKFGIHRGLLTKSSPFFSQILRPSYVHPSKDVLVKSEGETTVVYLPEEDSKTFARVNNWFFTQQFRTPGERWEDVSWQHLIQVYLFSVDKEITCLHNTCINATILKVKAGALFPGQDSINFLWRAGPRSTPLQRLFVRLFAHRCDLKSAIRSNVAFNQQFLNLLVIEQFEMQRRGVKGEDVDFFAQRKEYFVTSITNPIPLD